MGWPEIHREDESRIRDEHFRASFAWLNRFTLSLLHQNQSPGSIAMKRRSCGWDFDYLAQVLTGKRSEWTLALICQAGKLRVEGKAYVMQDGDICHFLFSA